MPNHASLRLRAAIAALALAALPAGLSAQLSVATGSLGLLIPAARRPSMVVVPDVRGQTLSGAAARVSVAGLVPRHAASSAGNVDTSPVRRQWPRAGQRVPQGTVVALELGSAAAAAATSIPVAGHGARSPMADVPPARWLAHTAISAIADAPAAKRVSAAWAWWLIAGAVVALLAHVLSRVVVPAHAEPQAAGSNDPAAEAEPGAPKASGSVDGVSPVAVRVRSDRRAPPLVVSASAVGSARASDIIAA